MNKLEQDALYSTLLSVETERDELAAKLAEAERENLRLKAGHERLRQQAVEGRAKVKRLEREVRAGRELWDAHPRCYKIGTAKQRADYFDARTTNEREEG